MENKKDKKLIDLYKEWIEVGKIPNQGLCNSITNPYLKTLELFNPLPEEESILRSAGQAWAYWGYEGSSSADPVLRCYEFTDLRQVVTLFICAIHNEL